MSDYKDIIKAFDMMPEAVFLLEKGEVTGMNPAGEKLCMGRTLHDLLPGEALEPCLAPKTVAAEVDGKRAAVSVTPLESGSMLSVRFDSEGADIAGFTRALRSPAGNLSLAAGLMRPVAEFIGNEEMEQYTAMITRDSLRIKRVADNAELFGRLEAGKCEFNAVRTELAGFLKELTDSVSALSAERRISVAFSADSGEHYAEIDPSLFETAMLQLLSNALKYAGIGGSVKVTLKAAGGRLIIAVADSGRGFSTHSLATAFETWKEEPPADEPERGAGLGLAIVSAIAGLHGGIAVAENISSGALVTIIIPQSSGRENSGGKSIRFDGGAMTRILTQLSDALGYKNYISKYLD